MAVGVIGLGTAVLNLFSSVGDRPDSADLVESCEVGTPQFLLALAGVLNAPLRYGGEARLLNNGDEYFPAMLESIRRAEKTINFTVYIWAEGRASDAMFEALLERARAGVQVRILVDALGAHSAPEEQIDALRNAGAHWEGFHAPRFGKLTRLHRRTHRRALIIDGKVGYTGGAAIADYWLDAEGPEYWRDCMVEVRGELALSLQSAFTQLWAHTTGELISGDGFYPLPEGGLGEEREVGDYPHVHVISSPAAEAHPMRHLFWFTIKSTRKRLYITNPYFVPDNTLKAVIIDRAKAGVDVRLLVPGEKIDIQPIRRASQSYYEEILESGARIFEYQPRMIHQKLLVADGVWSIVGSVNLDVRSKELNQENALGILDPAFASAVEETFLKDLEDAREITLEEWRMRGPWAHVRERFFRLFEEQF